MKIKLTLFALLFCISVFAQEKKDSLALSKNQLGFYFSKVDYFSEFSQDLKTYAFGLNYSRKLSKRFKVDAGLFFSREKKYYENLTFGDGLNNDFDTSFNVDLRSRFVEMPIKFRYNLIPNKNFEVHIFSGVLLKNYFSHRSQTTLVVKSSGENTTGGWYHYKPSNSNEIELGMTFGFAFQYNFSPKWTLALQPEFRAYFSSSKLDDVLDLDYSISTGFGVAYNF
ncbi:MAG: hypothetical protein V4622_12895 [Bacteroidota bacterium]